MLSLLATIMGESLLLLMGSLGMPLSFLVLAQWKTRKPKRKNPPEYRSFNYDTHLFRLNGVVFLLFEIFFFLKWQKLS